MRGTLTATRGTLRLPCQVDWWIPVYDFESDNAMAFHPRYWNRPVRNNSIGYNYYEWNKLHRGANVAGYTKEDPRPLPRATEPIESDPQIRLVCPVGGLIMFSGAQMHSSVPNTSGKTRFSIDFRVVHLEDVVAKRGAPPGNEGCTGHHHEGLFTRDRFLAHCRRGCGSLY